MIIFNKFKTFFYLIVLFAVILFFRSGEFNFSLRIDDYIYSSWLFSYEYGFMRRALPGEIISLLNIDYDYKSIRLISFFILLSLFLIFSYLILNTLDALSIKENKFLYLSSFMFLSFLTTQWILEIGRFDQIIQIMQLICIICMINKMKYYISFLLIILTIVLSALIHEASLIIFIPTIILIFQINYNNKNITMILIAFLLTSLILIISYGKIDSSHSSLIIEKYKDLLKFNFYAVRTTQLSNFENILTSYYSFMNNKTYIPIFLSIVYLYPVIFIFKKVFCESKFFYIFIVALTPIGLSIIAFDYFRWISLSLFNLSILSCYLIISGKINNINVISSYIIENKNRIISYGVISLFVGALGVVNLFPGVHNEGGLSAGDLPVEILTKLNMPANTNSQSFEVNNKNDGWYIETDFSQYKNLEEAKKYYENKSSIGNDEAQNNLALMYIRGGDFNIDYKKAKELFLDSSQNNNPAALNNLGVLYTNGLGVSKNGETALIYFQKSANLGSAVAMYNIAIMYKKGLAGLEKNKDKAKFYFVKSANLNYALAQHELKISSMKYK